MYSDINLVVGSGVCGATIARKIAENCNEKVLVIDKKPYLAGNCYDYKDENGITIHKFGSHIFHTNNEDVWMFLNRFTDFYPYMHKVYAVIDGIETTIPFNLNTLYNVFPTVLAKRLEEKLLKNFEFNSKVPILEFKRFEDDDLNFLADYIYKKVFLNYTMKQWGFRPEEIDGAVTARVPVLVGKDCRYFQDKYQGIPLCGYTKMVENILNHHNIEIKSGVEYKEIMGFNFKRIFYTGSIDEFFDYKFGILPYRSVAFKVKKHNYPYYQNNSVINYPNNYDFTRIHEYKYYLNEKSDATVIAKEYSSKFMPGVNERCYPIVNETNTELYNRYYLLASNIDNLYFLGRLGDYKYYDMDKAIERALGCFKEVFENKTVIY